MVNRQWSIARAALFNNDWISFDALIEQGWDIDELDHSHRSVVWYAAADSHWEKVEALIKRGANPEHALEGLLTFGVGSAKHFEWVINAVKDINISLLSGKRALHLATQNRSYDAYNAMDLMLKKGADPNALDSTGLSALAWMMKRFSLERADLLLASGADLHAKTGKVSNSLAHHAVYWGDSSALNWLKQKGLSLEEKNSLGETPLSRAIELRRIDLALFLIKQGVKIDQKDRKYKTPLYLAVAAGLTDVAKALMDAGADAEQRTGKNGQGKSPMQLVRKAGSGKERVILLPRMEQTALEEVLIPMNSSAMSRKSRTL